MLGIKKTTLCLIVKDESAQLRACIDSFKDLFSNIVIVDTGSKDNTSSVAKKLGAEVFKHKWLNDFSSARNFALSKVKTEWVLIVDADDRIEEKDKKNLKRELQNIKETVKIITCPYIYSKTGQAGPRVRFFKTNLNLKFIYPVHEKLQIPDKYQKNHISIEIPFLHLKNSEDFKKGFERNVEIMNKYIKKHPKDERILYYLSHDNYLLDKFENSIKWCEKFLQNHSKNSYKKNKVLTREGLCYKKLNKPLKAINSYLSAITVAPDLIEPYLYLGDMYLEQNKYNEAIELYQIASKCEYPHDNEMSFNKARYTYHANLRLSYTLPKIGENQKALQLAKKVQEYIPSNKKLSSHIKKLQSCLL